MCKNTIYFRYCKIFFTAKGEVYRQSSRSDTHEKKGDDEAEEKACDYLPESVSSQNQPGCSNQAGNQKNRHKKIKRIGFFDEIAYRHHTSQQSANAKHVCAYFPPNGNENGYENNRNGRGGKHQKPAWHAYPVVVKNHYQVRNQHNGVGNETLFSDFKRQVGDQFQLIDHVNKNAGNHEREKDHRRHYHPKLIGKQ